MAVKKRMIVLAICSALRLCATEPPPKELLTYIQEAQKLGLAEQAIRQNALGAGWDNKLIDEAFSSIKSGPVKPSGKADLPEGYRISPGDVIQVSVFKEPDASVPGVMVRADGKVSLPLIKEVEIGGYTPSEAEK